MRTINGVTLRRINHITEFKKDGIIVELIASISNHRNQKVVYHCVNYNGIGNNPTALFFHKLTERKNTRYVNRYIGTLQNSFLTR